MRDLLANLIIALGISVALIIAWALILGVALVIFAFLAGAL